MAIEFYSFGARMRHERERRSISIASIAERTKILGALLEGLEEDDVSRWPTGLYRRAFMRAYAGAIGLDPEATLKEFLERFPDPEAPPPPLTILPAGAPAVVPDTRSAATRFLGAWFRPGALVRGFRVRCLAAAADLFVIWVLGVACFAVFGQLWAPLSVAAVTYYGLGILVLGNTPGVCFFADAGKAFSQGHALPFKLRLPRLRRGPAHASEPPPLAQR